LTQAGLRRLLPLAIVGLLATGALLGVGWASAAVSFQDLEESLTCQCGCGLTVHSCNHLQCPSAIPLREEIRAQMATGKDRAAILSYFADKYGEKILSAPTATGFNLLAWVTPFVLLAIAGAVIGLTIVRWSARKVPASREPPLHEPPAPSPYDKILERELKNFDR
jgi:cytochrome c-type biogenesis protein CcmH